MCLLYFLLCLIQNESQFPPGHPLHRFTDEISITIKAGNGGAGAIAFRHEKFVEFGGPDGGDGGDGGSVIFQPDERVVTLSHLRSNRVYRAGNGQTGQGRLKSGKKGRDLIFPVPFGTVITDLDGNILHDFLEPVPWLAAEGAMGGRGNAFFKSSTNQTPRFAQPGIQTEPTELHLELKLIADIGFVGFPNAGKSSLLKALTSANPRIASYPFTTLTPNLGVLSDGTMRALTIADIPGIIEGASRGIGLGISFLKHIDRVSFLIFLLDISTAYGEEELIILKDELESYSSNLLNRPWMVVFNKIDLVEDRAFLREWMDAVPVGTLPHMAISAATGEGIVALRETLLSYFREREHKI